MQEENTYSETKKALKTPNRGRTRGQGNHRRKREDFEGLTKEGGGRGNLAQTPRERHQTPALSCIMLFCIVLCTVY